MGTTKASAAKADRLKTAHLQQMMHLAEGIADIMEIRGYLSGTATSHQEYVAALRGSHSETLHRFSIALSLHSSLINDLAETKDKLTAFVVNNHKLTNLVSELQETVKQTQGARESDAAKHEDEYHAATELIETLRAQNAQLHRKLEDAAAAPQLAQLQAFGIGEESPFQTHQEAMQAKYKEFWYRLIAMYGHRIPTKNELVTIGVHYDLWSEIMVARQATFDIRAPDHGKKIGCIDSNHGKEYPDAVPIDLYFRNGADGCEAKTGGEPKSNLVWFYPVIR